MIYIYWIQTKYYQISILVGKVYNYIPKDYKFKIQPFKHQIDGINYGLNYDKFLLGDEQGLGKTAQAIHIACIKQKQKNYRHCLIVCGVNGLKWNWKSEVKKHSNENSYILGTRYDSKGNEKIGTMQERLEDLIQLEQLYDPNYYIPSEYIDRLFINSKYFLITNIETLRNEEIIKKLKELCDKKIINMIVVDEMHKMKDPRKYSRKTFIEITSRNYDSDDRNTLNE